MKLYLELLSDQKKKMEEDDILKKLGGQVDKLDFLLHSMVKMSRLETGTIRIQKQPTCIADTLAAAIGAVVPCADRNFSQESASGIPERGLHRSGRARFFQDFTGNRRSMTVKELELVCTWRGKSLLCKMDILR